MSAHTASTAPTALTHCTSSTIATNPFTAYVHSHMHSPARLAPAIILLLINLPVCIFLTYVSRLADKARQNSARQGRIALFAHALDQYAQVYKGVQLLCVELASCVHEAEMMARTGTSASSNAGIACQDETANINKICRARRDEDEQEDIAKRKRKAADRLARLERRLVHLERCITEAREPGSGERLLAWLGPRELFGTTVTRPRCLAGAGAVVLVFVSMGAVGLAPLAILACMRCDEGGMGAAVGEGTITAFWVLYALFTVVPAVVAWGGVGVATMHWRVETCQTYRGYDAREIEESGTTEDKNGGAVGGDCKCLAIVPGAGVGAAGFGDVAAGNDTDTAARGIRDSGMSCLSSEDEAALPTRAHLGPYPWKYVGTTGWVPV